MRQEATLHIRLDLTLRSELEEIQEDKGHKKLSITVREALDEYVRNNSPKATKILSDHFL